MAGCYNPGLKIQHFLLLCFATGLVLGQQASAPKPQPRPALPFKTRELLNRITADDLRGDLSFLASDALAGRFTPSPGLDAAAEFIASRFRAAGLEPAGGQDYFQIANMVDRRLPKMTGELKFESGSQRLQVPADSLTLYRAAAAAHFENTPGVVFHTTDLNALQSADVKGKAVIEAQPDFAHLSQEQRIAEHRKLRAFGKAAREAGAVLEIIASETKTPAPHARLLSAEEAEKQDTPVLLAASPELLGTMKQSENPKISVDIPAPDDQKVTGRNVIAVLRGSDSKLKDTYVLLTAHYDHVGTIATAAGMAAPVKNPGADKIYNGANDDGSGTVSVIEIARAFARLNPRPRRSIVFMTFFGEERGLLGSQFYAEHPVFPLAKTVANINLEQVGRTDATNGKQVNTASLTGYDYSTVAQYLEKAGTITGIKVYKDAEGSDAYFTQSDNSPLADKGVPAHSLCVAFDYPDYHGLGDEWPKIDYDNMTRVDRMVALAVLNLANDVKTPLWNAQNPKTAPFRTARQRAQPGT
ncbi:MAG TPA: M28 family peptidase [Bryobacteraceae bacterium]